jgi:hypothetical protein
MKRSGFLRRNSSLSKKGKSETATLKDEIQQLVRAIVILRDGGCILRNTPDVPACNGVRKDGQQILQADHLITRANSATYADTRLIVCVCKGHHGWKKWHQKQYEAAVRSLLSTERVALWDRAEQDSWRPKRTGASDWRLEIAALKQELRQMGEQKPSIQYGVVQ